MKGNLLVGTIVPILVLTALAAGGGAVVGTRIASAVRVTAVKEPQAQSRPGAPSAGEPATLTVKELAPIVTNLASPAGAIVRLQTAIVYDRSDASQMDVVAGRVGDDILAFVKTLTMAQIEGASGLQHLREDLNERASVRSDGRVHELMIEMLVVQ